MPPPAKNVAPEPQPPAHVGHVPSGLSVEQRMGEMAEGTGGRMKPKPFSCRFFWPEGCHRRFRTEGHRRLHEQRVHLRQMKIAPERGEFTLPCGCVVERGGS